MTDADVVLGYINPDKFHGGHLPLDKDLAVKAIREKVADPLGVSVEEAAMRAKRIVDSSMGGEIYKETVLKGFDPRDFILFAIGGAGPVHATGFGAAARLETIAVSPYSSTFCAFGSSTMDIVHLYEKSLSLQLLDLAGNWLADYDTFNDMVDELIARARKDFRGEGFGDREIAFQLELDLKFGGQLNSKRAMSPILHVRGTDDPKAIYAAFEKEYSETFSPLGLTPDAGVEIENFVLRATIRTEKPRITKLPLKGRSPKAAGLGTRRAFWNDIGWQETPVYDRARLMRGNGFKGPAIVEAEDTTIVVEPGWSFTIDEYGNALLRHAKAKT